MDKYEYKISLQEIDQLISEHRFDEAASIANKIDWSHVKNPATLCKISDIYKINKEYAKSRRMLVLANEKDPENPEIIFSLCELTIFLYGRDRLPQDLVNAVALKDSYQKAEPGNPKGLILEYKLYKVTNTSVQERIAVLEQLRKTQYTARWGYELALCYREAGNLDAAAAECRSVMSSFGGKYADKAQQLLLTLTDSAPQDSSASKIEAATAAAIASEKPAVDPSPVIGNAGAEDRPAADPAGPVNFAAPQDTAPGMAAPSNGTVQDTGMTQPDGGIAEAAGTQYQGYPYAQMAQGNPQPQPEGENPAVYETAQQSGVNTPAYGNAPAAEGNTAYGTPSRPEENAQTPDCQAVAGEMPGNPTAAMRVTMGADSPVPSAQDQNPAAGAGRSQNPAESEEGRENSPAAQAQGTPGSRDTRAGSALEPQTAPATGSRMTIGQVMSEWEKIKRDVKAQNDQRREQKILEDTGRLLHEFDETSKHTMLEDIEKNVERLQREARKGYAYTDLSDGLTADEKRRAREAGRYAAPEEDAYAHEDESAYDTEDFRGGNAGAEDGIYDAQEDGAVYPDEDELREEQPENGSGAYPEEAAEDNANPAAGLPQEQDTGSQDAAERVTEEEPSAEEESTAPAATAPAVAGQAAEDAGQGEEFNTAPQAYREPAYQETLFEDDQNVPAAPAAEPVGGAPAGTASYVPLTADSAVAAHPVRRAQPSPRQQFVSNRQGETSTGAEQHDYGTAQPAEELPVVDPNDDHSTRRWNAASVRRAMEAEKARFAAADAADRARIEKAVEHAGEPQTEDASRQETAVEKSAAENTGSVAGTGTAGSVGAAESTRAEADTQKNTAAVDTAEAARQPETGHVTEEAAADTYSSPANGSGRRRRGLLSESPAGEETAEDARNDDTDGTDDEERRRAQVEAAKAARRGNRVRTLDEEAPAQDETSFTEEIQTGLAQDAAAEEPEEETAAGTPEETDAVAEEDTAEGDVEESDFVVRPAADAGTAEQETRRQRREDQRPSGRGRKALAAARDGELSEEERRLFGPIAMVKENQEQIAAALDKISLASYTGNVIITGPEQAATRVAQGLLEITKQGDNNFTGRIAKAPVRALNKLTPEKLAATLGRIENGALQIEGASSLKEEVLAALHHELEDKDRGLIVIMLDGTRAMNSFVEKYKDYLGSFNVRIDIQSLNDKALVSYGKEYALAKDYTIDDLGQLALSTRIASRQSRDHQVSTKEVREIVDEAISYASRKSLHTLWEILTHKRYDEDDRIIIHEKDFMHY